MGLTWQDILEDLSVNYAEMYHEDVDVFDPEGYEARLADMSEQQVLDEYNDLHDTELTLEDVD